MSGIDENLKVFVLKNKPKARGIRILAKECALKVKLRVQFLSLERMDSTDGSISSYFVSEMY